MKKIIRVKQNSESPMHLTWIINNICTNSCGYCHSDVHNGKNHHYDWDNARKFLYDLNSRYKKIHCSIAGGEPSVSPFLPELVKIFYDNGHTVGCTSNAAKPIKYWSEISKYLNYICFSYHPDFIDKDFLQKALAASANTLVTIRIMMLPSKWNHCIEVYNEMSKEKDIFVEIVRILDWKGNDRTAHIYNDEQEYFFKNYISNRNYREHPQGKRGIVNLNADFFFNDGTVETAYKTVDYINTGMTNFNGYTCEIGLKSLFISHNGDIKRGNCMVGGIIGNINFPNDINWPTDTIKCDSNICHCTTDVQINKWI